MDKISIKIDRIRSQQIRDSYDIQAINEWLERKRREWDEHVTRIDAERLSDLITD